MKTVIAGSRKGITREDVREAISLSTMEDRITELVWGMAPGADRWGQEWAREKGLPIAEFPANWASYGNAAGPLRNKDMAEYADALIAVWDGDSTGTLNMINEALKNELEVFIHVPERYRDKGGETA